MMFAVKGTFVDTPLIGTYRTRVGYAVVDNGVCLGVFSTLPTEYSNIDIKDYGNSLIIPGMSDLHLHAPQYSYCGTAMDVQLLEWLEKYTYPEEGRYGDIEYAKKGYANFVKDLKNTTTTRAVIFATIHNDATLELMKQLDEAGFVAYVGKLNMNRNAPDYYCEKSVEQGMKDTRAWIEKCNFKNVKPIITPRFTPSVTDDYMCELGKLARETGLGMQSHLNENRDEIKWVKALCPDSKHYSDTYDRYGLFGGECPTVMAHCIYCTKEEDELIKKNGVYIAHCPTSNENVLAGIAPAGYYLRNGYHIGLGSDVAGGHTLSLLDVMVTSVQVSKLRSLYVDNSIRPLSMAEAFYMATVGGGSFFGKVGLFEKGYEFDAVVIDDANPDNPMEFAIEERIERLAYLGCGNIIHKYIKGA